MVTAALAALLLAAPGTPPLPAPAAAPVTPSLHVSIGTGYCDRASI